jgi:hypothetical protein
LGRGCGEREERTRTISLHLLVKVVDVERLIRRYLGLHFVRASIKNGIATRWNKGSLRGRKNIIFFFSRPFIYFPEALVLQDWDPCWNKHIPTSQARRLHPL